jgi:ribosomal protein S18 acetylase RimI-like enzyme
MEEIIYKRMNGGLIDKAIIFLHSLNRPYDLDTISSFTYGNGRVALINDEIIGIVLYGYIPKQFNCDINFTLVDVGIKEKYRRLGICKKLIGQIIYLFPKDIYLQVDQNNLPAIKLYQSLGFEIIEFLFNYYGEEKHAWYMKRSKI